MSDSIGAPMTRARLYVLMDAFERDIRGILAKYVLSELPEADALGSLYAKANQRRIDDPAASQDVLLVEYLDLGESFNLLNTHRSLIPSDLAREVREFTPNIDRIIGIRNRVMHARPLLVGDGDAAPALLWQLQTKQWPELKRTLAHLDEDPAWEP